jgi:hypothetical protein
MNPRTKTIEIPAREVHPTDLLVGRGLHGGTTVREITAIQAHLGGRELLLEFEDGGSGMIVKPDQVLTIEEGDLARAVRREVQEAAERVAPDAREIGAGDDVVVLDGKGGIDHEGVLCDVFDGDRAEVQTGTRKRIMVPLDRVAHPDSKAAEACAISDAEAGAVS